LSALSTWNRNSTNTQGIMGFHEIELFYSFRHVFNINHISLQSVLLVEETGVPGKNPRPVAGHWQALSHNVVSSTPRLSGIQNSQRVNMYILKFLFVNLYIYIFMCKRMKSISYICTSVRQILANKKLFCVFCCIRRKLGQIICLQGNNKSMVIFVLKRRKMYDKLFNVKYLPLY
jgi:hypothetical protein